MKTANDMATKYEEELKMKSFLSNFLQSLTPYTAGEQPQDRTYIKLNTNENPYPPSPKAAEALRGFDLSRLKLYPSTDAPRLREAIAKAEGVDKENVFCGNGSDEVLALCIPAFFDKDGKGAAFADLTYSFYPVFCDFFSVPYHTAPLNEDYTMNLEAFTELDCQGVLLCNPNAPTGIGIDRARMTEFLEKNPHKLIIADEAYMGFYGESLAPFVKKFRNLLVIKTFSKYYALAGIRCGYAIGDESLIKGLFASRDCFNSYPLDMLCQVVCTAAVSDGGYYRETSGKVIEERTHVRDELLKMGFFVPESSTNFLFAGNESFGGEYIYRGLKERGVLVRFWNTEKLKNFCRITIGSPEQNDRLLSALKDLLGR